MGKQINYYMGYEEFLTIAQKALECGCKILKRVDGKILQGDTISFVTMQERNYYFYLPEAGALYTKTRANGHETVGGYDASGNVVIEAGYSNKNTTDKYITRSRLFVISGYYDEQGQWIPRPECLEKVYNKLVRVAKKVAPYTELTDTYSNSRNGREGEYKHKEYITDEFLKLKLEKGYRLK